jgi:hypothetical protein
MVTLGWDDRRQQGAVRKQKPRERHHISVNGAITIHISWVTREDVAVPRHCADVDRMGWVGFDLGAQVPDVPAH